MKNFILYIFVLISGNVAAQYLRNNYEMREKSFTGASYNLLNFKTPGATTGIQGRYCWNNAQGDQSGISFGVILGKLVQDTMTAFALPGNKPPVMFDTINYKWTQYNFLYHYHRYILETQYDDALGFYISGSGGISLYSYGKVDQIDRNHFRSDYQYRTAGTSLFGQLAWGTHFQFYDNLRLMGETGPYMFREADLKLRGEPNTLRMGWNLTIGLQFGF
jgi:hypothetical protein